MMIAMCRARLRDNANKIIAYELETEGGIITVEASKLKQRILDKQIEVTNLKLTSDGRLVESANNSGDFFKDLGIDKAEQLAIEDSKRRGFNMFSGCRTLSDEEMRQALSKGRVSSEETKRRTSNMFSGCRTLSDEEMRQALSKGRVSYEETKRRTSNIFSGCRTLSNEEMEQALSKGRVSSEESNRRTSNMFSGCRTLLVGEMVQALSKDGTSAGVDTTQPMEDIENERVNNAKATRDKINDAKNIKGIFDAFKRE